ncbi:unnamed protein product [Mytilus coruscus]|uniref:Uncharacterized protein n=1 Tax=Mytilus coruscus TaxID=42192 RepID=A0A6J8F4T3_MYTCO|nr:unnamed protein product [Mytilus coruscus]
MPMPVVTPILREEIRQTRQLRNSNPTDVPSQKKFRCDIKLANYDDPSEWSDFKSHFDACTELYRIQLMEKRQKANESLPDRGHLRATCAAEEKTEDSSEKIVRLMETYSAKIDALQKDLDNLRNEIPKRKEQWHTQIRVEKEHTVCSGQGLEMLDLSFTQFL